jgi:phospholipid/cholesterol/gamma-HCH transport system substrate-binding protein
MSTAAKVGAFFLVALVLAGLLIWKIEDLKFGGRTGKVISVQFSDVAGLKEKSDVRMAGVLVGKVARIRLVGGKALVDIELNRDISLRDGASGTIQSLGMLGDKYIELVPGPVGAPPLAAGTTLKGETPVNFDQITRLARDIEVDVREITGNLKSSLGGALGEERLTGIVENVLVLSQELRKLLEANRANIDTTTANFKDFSTEMTKLVDRIDRLVAANSGGRDESVANAKELTSKLQTTVDNMNAITGKINEGKGTVGNLVNSDETAKNLNETLVAVKEGVNSLSDSLKTVKKINLDLGLREEYLTSPSKGKGYFTVDLARVGSPRFYRVELVTQPFGVRRDTAKIITTTYPTGTRRPCGRTRRSSRTRSRSRRRWAIDWATGSAAPADGELRRRRRRLPDSERPAAVLGRRLELRRRGQPERARQGHEPLLLLAVGLPDRGLGRLPEHEGEPGLVLRGRRRALGRRRRQVPRRRGGGGPVDGAREPS